MKALVNIIIFHHAYLYIEEFPETISRNDSASVSFTRELNGGNPVAMKSCSRDCS